jgi:hypothetical protein
MPRIGAAAPALALALATASAQAQTTTTTSCGDLAGKYDTYVKTADTLITDLVGKALQGGDSSGMLQQLGLDAQGTSAEQAARKGAVAALSPPSQAAILIYLLRANTAMQEMIWKDCRPPG